MGNPEKLVFFLGLDWSQVSPEKIMSFPVVSKSI